MKKSILNWSLVAVMLCGAGLSFTACSDDDDEEGTAGREQRGPDSATNISGTIEEDILRHLVYLWTDVQKSEMTGSWASREYEPTVGVVDDESQPFVRTIQVDSIGGADQYAVECFGTFGIDSEHPDGFSYSNAAVGHVSYRHSSDPNTLAVITIDGVRQLPHLQQIRLVESLPENAAVNPYYGVGDVVRYNNRLWVCVTNHKGSEKAKFVSFIQPEDCRVGTFKWSGVGVDSVYTTEMADHVTLIDWIANILINDRYYVGDQIADEKRSLIEILDGLGYGESINQIMPRSMAVRLDLAKALFDPAKIINDVSGYSSNHINYVWNDDEDAVEQYNQEHGLNRLDNMRNVTYRMAPHGYLLCNKMRYAIGSITSTSWHQWVPYVMCVPFGGWGRAFELMAETPSQNTLDQDHFRWVYTIKHNYNRSNLLVQNGVEVGSKFYAFTAAFYWQHENAYLEADPDREVADAIGWGRASNVLMDFTRDWKNHSRPNNRLPYVQNPDLWTSRNILTAEQSFTDNGREKTGYETVWRWQH